MRDWDAVLAVARAYGYTGPDTPADDGDNVALAEMLRRAVRDAGGPEPLPGTGPAAWIGRVVQGEVPLP